MDNQRRIMRRVKKNFWGNESGAVAVFAAIGMVVFLGVAALAPPKLVQ